MDTVTIALLRTFGLSRLLARDPAAVEAIFQQVFGSMGGHHFYKLSHECLGRVDDWWYGLDQQ